MSRWTGGRLSQREKRLGTVRRGRLFIDRQDDRASTLGFFGSAARGDLKEHGFNGGVKDVLLGRASLWGIRTGGGVFVALLGGVGLIERLKRGRARGVLLIIAVKVVLVGQEGTHVRVLRRLLAGRVSLEANHGVIESEASANQEQNE